MEVRLVLACYNLCMKSQVIRIKNIPDYISVRQRVQLKPTLTLVLMIMAGMLFVAAKPYLVLGGIMMTMLGAFCLFVMPDGVLCGWRVRRPATGAAGPGPPAAPVAATGRTPARGG